MSRLLAACALIPVLAVCGQGCSKVESKPEPSPDQLVSRGKYLVEGVGMCGDCHTPMGPQGPDLSKWLQGSEVPFVATVPIPDWAPAAPAIAGLPSLEDDEALSLLTTGALPSGSTLRPPMPQYRMSKDDATAVVAYLRSLGAS